MRRCTPVIFFSFLSIASVFGSTVASAQTQAAELALKAPIDREMKAGETHVFEVRLEADQFIFAVVEQQGIDVIIRVIDPNGERVEEIDNLGAQGPEFISLFPGISGTYRMEVLPFEEDSEPGRYTINVERLEPAATTNPGKVDQLFAPWNRPGSPGASIAIVQNGEIVHKRGYGCAQLEYYIPIEPSTVFHVASVSKQFTAFAIAMLAEEGKLSLDDDIREYLPEIHDFGETITIRHLIHHASGIRDQWNLLALAGWRLDDVITLDQIMRLVGRQRELNFKPGDEMVYCNTGYTLLAEIVTRVTGQQFPEWTKENIFQPLGMTSTHFHDDHQMIVPNRAYSYQSDPEGGFRKSVLSYANVGATSLFTTVEDMAKWINNFDDPQVGGPGVIEQVHTRVVLSSGDTLGYGFGLSIGRHRGLRTVGHSGSDAGFRSYVVRYPDHDFAVVILSNLSGFNPSSMSRRVADFYLGDRLATEEEADEPAEPAVAISTEVLDDYAGEYHLAEQGLWILISRQGRNLTAEATGLERARLVPESETRFFISEADAHVTFQRDETGVFTHFILDQGGKETEAKRVPPFRPTADRLVEFTGDYYSPELGTTYTLVVQDSLLVATHVRHDPISLTPRYRDVFRGDSWFFGDVRFERNPEGGITGMRVSSGRVRNLLFVRQ